MPRRICGFCQVCGVAGRPGRPGQTCRRRSTRCLTTAVGSSGCRRRSDMRWAESPLAGSSPRRATVGGGHARSAALFARHRPGSRPRSAARPAPGTHAFASARPRRSPGLPSARSRGRARLGRPRRCAYAHSRAARLARGRHAPPFGMMALWPLSREYYLSGVDLFLGGVCATIGAGFWAFNLKSIARESCSSSRRLPGCVFATAASGAGWSESLRYRR